MSIAQRSIRSTGYTLIGSGITTVVQFVRSILLARLIAPEYFGIYSYISSIVILTSTIPSFGMASALLNRTPDTEGDKPFQVHFTVSLIFNLIWGLAIILIGLLILPPSNHWILLILLATQFLDNLVITSRYFLIRRVSFERIVIVDSLGIIFSTITALLLAWKGYGIQGLISTDVMTAIVTIIGLTLIQPPWKIKLGWSPKIIRYLLNFGYRSFFATVIGQALDYVDNLWTGFFLGSTALGYYSRAFTFSSYPRKVLAAPINSVATGTYAELKGNPKQLSQAFFRANALLIRSSFFMAGLLALVAPEFIYLVIGRKWLPMLDAFRLMLLFTMLDPIKTTLANLFVAIGKPEKVFWARLLQLVVLIVSLFIFGKLWNISGVAIAVNLMILSGIIVMLWQAHAYVNFSIQRLFSVPLFGLAVGLLLARLAIEIPGILGSYWRTGIIKAIVFTIIYIGVIGLFEYKELPSLVSYIKLLLPKRETSHKPVDN